MMKSMMSPDLLKLITPPEAKAKAKALPPIKTLFVKKQ